MQKVTARVGDDYAHERKRNALRATTVCEVARVCMLRVPAFAPVGIAPT